MLVVTLETGSGLWSYFICLPESFLDDSRGRWRGEDRKVGDVPLIRLNISAQSRRRS